MAISTYGSKTVKSDKALLPYPTVAPIDTLVACTILQILTTSVVSVIALSMIIILFVRYIEMPNWLPILEASGGSCMLGVGVALSNAVLVLRYPLHEELFSFFGGPLVLTSGIFFLLENIPFPHREYLLDNPPIHVLVFFRRVFYTEPRGYDLNEGYLGSLVMTCFVLGLSIFTILRGTFRQEE